MWRSGRCQAEKHAADGDVPHSDGIAFGWRAHEAIQGWTSSVDFKASVVVVLEAAVAGAGSRALLTPKGQLHEAVGLHLATAITAVTLLVLSVGCALWVVFPRLERPRTHRVGLDGLIYFGHLRQRGAEDIATALAELTADEERRQLASQLCITSTVAWSKHSWLQQSLVLFSAGSLLLLLALAAF